MPHREVAVLIVEVLVAVAVLVGIAFVAGRDVGGLEDEPADLPDTGLPDDRPVTADDVSRLRFRVVAGFWGGLRGYRFADVDAALDAVERTLRTHEERAAAPAEPEER